MEPAGGAQNVVSYITEQTIKELKEYYPEKVAENIKSLPEVLSRINHATGNKFIVIIDEWDVLIRDKNADEKVQAECRQTVSLYWIYRGRSQKAGERIFSGL